jgi:hypothetical protein
MAPESLRHRMDRAASFATEPAGIPAYAVRELTEEALITLAL